MKSSSTALTSVALVLYLLSVRVFAWCSWELCRTVPVVEVMLVSRGGAGLDWTAGHQRVMQCLARSVALPPSQPGRSLLAHGGPMDYSVSQSGTLTRVRPHQSPTSTLLTITILINIKWQWILNTKYQARAVGWLLRVEGREGLVLQPVSRCHRLQPPAVRLFLHCIQLSFSSSDASY